MYKLKVQRNKCNACGMCMLECNVLHEDSAGIVEVIGEGIIADADVGKIKDVIELCPTGALSLIEDSINVAARIAELKNKMKEPLTFTPPSKDNYAFSLEDKDQYAEELTRSSSASVDGDWEYNYKSYESAKSAGERAFRDEIYSQADALGQQVIVMYEQRKMNKVARYAETNGNYKYGVHQRLIKKLRAFVNEIESYTGKKISLPSNFYNFYTKDTEYIDNLQDHANKWVAEGFKENMKPASEFYTCVKTDKTDDYVKVSHWFGDDEYKTVKKYAYYINEESIGRFYRYVARAAWYAGKYTSKFCERELERFHKEITEEWNDKISYLLRQI